MSASGARCDFPKCGWKVEAVNTLDAYRELVGHDDETGHDRHKWGHIDGL